MAPSCRRACWLPRCGRSSCWRRRNRLTHRRLGNNWTRCGNNLRGLRGWNDHRLWNCHYRRRSGYGLRFHGARSRRSGADWFSNNRNQEWGYHGRRRWSCHSRLHARGSGRRIFRRLIRYRLVLGLRLGLSDRAKMLAHLYRGFHFNRTGMRFLLGDSSFGQIVNDGLCLNLEFASQFVDSDLIRIGHCPPGPLLFPVLV